ncbi:24648_t:CDS:1, partial [Gigaspora margarita]
LEAIARRKFVKAAGIAVTLFLFFFCMVAVRLGDVLGFQIFN